MIGLYIIIVVVIILVVTQLRLVLDGNSKIKLLHTVFESDGTNKKIFKSSDQSKKFVIQDIYIPKRALKILSWEEVKNKIALYKYYNDDIKEEKTPNYREIINRKKIITDLENQLNKEMNSVEASRLKRELQAAKIAYAADEKLGKFETIKQTIICKREDKEKIQIILFNNSNPVAADIERSINTYLLRNKGAVSDFNLIKDIVERNCDAIATEIESVTPMPLYLGLAGTMLGIIIGLGVVGINNGFGDIQSFVNSLMSEVALAMIASLMGVLSTTLISWKSRKCNVRIESDKNYFYTWIQTELLPVLSSSTVSTLTLLERNLTKFNQSFGETIVRLDDKLSKVGETYGQQLEILRRIEKLDVTKMATANVKILHALDSSSGNLESFAMFMQNSTTYLSEVRKLTNQLDSYLARTGSLETIADFYKKQMNEIISRQDAIKSSVVNVDDVVQKALADLEEHTEQGLMGLKQTYVKLQDEMERIAQQQGGVLNDKLAKLDAIITFIEKMQPLVVQISKMENAINNAANRAESASRSEITAINNLAEVLKKGKLVSSSNSRSHSGQKDVTVGTFESSGRGIISRIIGVFKRKKKKIV